jgi:hypothetical protein
MPLLCTNAAKGGDPRQKKADLSPTLVFFACISLVNPRPWRMRAARASAVFGARVLVSSEFEMGATSRAQAQKTSRQPKPACQRSAKLLTAASVELIETLIDVQKAVAVGHVRLDERIGLVCADKKKGAG